jgi:CheY-like chemotaxis protein
MHPPKHILIAEDDSFMRALLVEQCRSLGLQTHAVSDGEQAITEALSYQYDVILTDIQMPVCDGLEAMKLLRRLGYDRLIIAMSADDIEAQGFDQVLPKPIDVQQLASLLLQNPGHQPLPLQVDKDLSALFYHNLHQLSIEFAVAWQAAERDNMRKICHKIKGGAASFGETELAKLADTLQRQLMSDTPLPELTQSCRDFAELLQQYGDADART